MTTEKPTTVSDAQALETGEQILAVLTRVSDTGKIMLKDARTRKDKEAVVHINTMLRQLTSVRKPIEKLQKSANAVATTKRRRASPKDTDEPRPPTGFQKPQAITNELSAFIGTPPDEPVSRVDVTRKLCEYIRVHNLQNQENRREIFVDAKLAKLLRHDAALPVTYYSLQSKIQVHFVKPSGTAAAKAAKPKPPASCASAKSTTAPVLKVLQGKVVV